MNRGRRGVAVALGTALATVASAEWPQFRGSPEHTATSPYAAGTLLLPVWTVRLPSVTAGGTTYTPRITGSPAIAGGNVFVGSNNTRLYAFQAADGAKVWEYDAGAPVRSSPLLAGGLAIFTVSNGSLVALSADTGAFAWKHSTGGFQDQSSPNVSGDLVVVGATFPQRKVYAVALTTGGSEPWRFDTGQPVFSSPAVDSSSGAIICGSNDGSLYALRPDGTPLWASPFPTQGGIFLASPSIANGRAYIAAGDFDYRMLAVDIATGGKAWEAGMTPTPTLPPGTSGITVSSPAVDGDFVAVVGGYGNAFGPSLLHAFRDEGSQAVPLWSAPLPNYLTESFASSPAITPTSVIVGVAAREDAAHPELPRGRVYVLDRATGESRWYAAGDPAGSVPGGPVLSSPAVSGDLVVVGDDSGLVTAYRLVVAGDIDGDGSVALMDAVLIAKAVASGQADTPFLVARADVAPTTTSRADGSRSFGNGVVNGEDLSRIVRKAAGLESGTWP